MSGAAVACAAARPGEPLVVRDPTDAEIGSQRQRYRWAVRIRWMAIAGFLVLGCVAWLAGVLRDPLPCVAAAAGATILNTFNHMALRRWQWIGPATAAAIVGDIVLLTYLVAATGGPSSPFVAMYFVQVLASAMLVRSRVALACAVAAVAALAWAILADPWSVVPDAKFVAIWSLFFLYGLGLIAYVGGYVSGQLRQREAALEEANSQLREALASLSRAHTELGGIVDRLESAERQLAQSEKMRSLGDFVAGVAHELNNPIAVVAANLEILGSGDIDGSETVEVLADCREAADRAARIVADLRQFSRGASAREWREVDLSARAGRTAELARHMFGPDVSLDLDLADVPTIRVVPEEMDQVLMNLLSNAALAVGRRGHIRLATSVRWNRDDARQEVVVRVEDDGPGVDGGVVERIFEPFFTTRGEGEGVGLGLSLSFAIVQRHGGMLRFDPSYRAGARFEIVMPVSAG